MYNLKQNVIRKIKKRHRTNFIIAISLFFIASFLMLFSIGEGDIKSISNSMVNVYNPINSLYSDNGNLIFTSGQIFNRDSVDLTIPIVSSEIEVDIQGNIHIKVVNSIMIKAPDAGVIEKVGTTLDGVKFIKINHNQSISTIIENLNVIGVESGGIVKKGQDIATAKEGEYVVLKVFLNGFQVNNIKLNQSKVVWED